jgi:hypothetical protein
MDKGNDLSLEFSKQSSQSPENIIIVQSTPSSTNGGKDNVYAMEISLDNFALPALTHFVPTSSVEDSEEKSEELSHHRTTAKLNGIGSKGTMKRNSPLLSHSSVIDKRVRINSNTSNSDLAKFDESTTGKELIRNVNHGRGLHRLRDNILNEDFWIPKLEKLSEDDRKASVAETGNSVVQVYPMIYQKSPFVRILQFLNWIVSFVGIILFVAFGGAFSLLVYVLQLPQPAKVSEQTPIIKVLLKLLTIPSKNIENFISSFFIDWKEDVKSVFLKPKIIDISDEFGCNAQQIGALRIYHDVVLGLGSHGTMVFTGTLHGRPIAVKRLLSALHKAADR